MNLNGRGWMLHYSSQFSNALAKKHDVRVIIPCYADTSLYSDVTLLWKIRTNPTLWSFLLDSINIFAHIGLITKIWKFRPDVLQIMDNHPWYFFYPKVARFLWAKVYVIQHDPFPHTWEKDWLFHTVAIWVNRSLRKASDLLIVHGEKMRTKVIETYRLPKEKVKSIYHGSLSIFGDSEEKGIKWKNTLLFFGRIVEYKGLDLFIEALQILEKTWVDFHAIIAWDGDMKPYQIALDRLDPKNIEIVNRFIEDSEIASFFCRSNFVVLPYKDATASWIIPLAYSFSLPVVATDVWVLSDYVRDGETGILLEKPQSDLLAEALEKLLKDTNLTETLGKNAKQFQEESLSWDAVIDSIYP